MEIAYLVIGGGILLVTSILKQTLTGRWRTLFWIIFVVCLIFYVGIGIYISMNNTEEKVDSKAKIGDLTRTTVEANKKIQELTKTTNDLLDAFRISNPTNSEKIERIERNLFLLKERIDKTEKKPPASIFATAEELKSPKLSKLSIRITDLVGDKRPLIKGKTFEDCDIYGPGIISLLKNVDLIGNKFNGPFEIMFMRTPPRFMLGLIGIEDCSFRGCYFFNIGIMGGEEVERKFKKTSQTTSQRLLPRK